MSPWVALSTVSSVSTDWITAGANNLPHQMPSRLTTTSQDALLVVWLVRSEPSPSFLAEGQWPFLDDPWVVKLDTPVLIASRSML